MTDVLPPRTVWPSALAAATAAIAVSFLCALGFLAGNGWFGIGDLSSFALLTFPFGILCYMAGGSLLRATSGVPVFWRLVLLLGGGLFRGFLYTLAISMILGPLFAGLSPTTTRSPCPSGNKAPANQCH
jgi:hypothetical protein